MAASTGKTLALILLVLFILFIGFRLTPLIVAPFGLFSGTCHLLGTHDLHHIGFWPRLFPLTFRAIPALALMILWIAVIIWVYRDAERRGMNGLLWGLLVFIGNLIGLLIYLIIRSDALSSQRPLEMTQACPNCRKQVGTHFAFCPYCGTKLQHVCPGCGKPAEANWNVCPHCGEKLTQADE